MTSDILIYKGKYDGMRVKVTYVGQKAPEHRNLPELSDHLGRSIDDHGLRLKIASMIDAGTIELRYLGGYCSYSCDVWGPDNVRLDSWVDVRIRAWVMNGIDELWANWLWEFE